MSKNLRIDLEIGLDKARAALKQLQQEANQISKARGGIGGSGGGSSSGGLFGGLGLSAAGAAAGAAAAAIAAVGAELKALSSRAVELSQSASSATSQLGQLRSAVERSNISKDVAATSPAVVSIAKAAADFQKEFSDALAAAGSTPQERQKALAEKLSAGLGGEDKETWRRMKEARSDLEVDISHQRQALDVAQFGKTGITLCNYSSLISRLPGKKPTWIKSLPEPNLTIPLPGPSLKRTRPVRWPKSPMICPGNSQLRISLSSKADRPRTIR
jgi:hypothetical protein